MLLEEMKNQIQSISEADVSLDCDWDFNDVLILKPADQVSQGGGGGGQTEGSGVLPVGKSKKQPQKPSQGSPQSGQNGKEQGQKSKGKTSGSGEKSGDQSTPQYTPGEGIELPMVDSHEHFGGGSETSGNEKQHWMEEMVEEAAEAAAEALGTEDVDQWGADPGNTWKSSVKKIRRQKLPISAICNKLKQFKLEIAQKESDQPSFALSPLSGTSMGGANQAYHRPYDVNHPTTDKNSALLLFAVDTSGSITDEDYEKVYGWLDTIAQFFENKSNGGIPGRVYLIEWDTNVYTPIRRWKAPKGPEPDHSGVRMRGGGGTDFQNVLDFINKNFIKTTEGNGYVNHKLRFADNMKDEEGKNLFDYDPKDKLYDVGNDHKIREIPKTRDKETIIGDPPEGHKFNYGDLVFEPNATKMANVPFLLVYTDGYFDTPTNFGPMYRDNLGNILFIATKKLYIHNLRPRNFIYCDMYLEGFEKEIKVANEKNKE